MDLQFYILNTVCLVEDLSEYPSRLPPPQSPHLKENAEFSDLFDIAVQLLCLYLYWVLVHMVIKYT